MEQSCAINTTYRDEPDEYGVITYGDEPKEYGIEYSVWYSKCSKGGCAVKIDFTTRGVEMIFEGEILTAVLDVDYGEVGNIRCIYHGIQYSVVVVSCKGDADANSVSRTGIVIIYDQVAKKCSFIQEPRVVSVCYNSNKIITNTTSGVNIYDIKGKLLIEDASLNIAHQSILSCTIHDVNGSLYTVVNEYGRQFAYKTQIVDLVFVHEKIDIASKKILWLPIVDIGNFVVATTGEVINYETFKSIGRYRTNSCSDVCVKKGNKLLRVSLNTGTTEILKVLTHNADATYRTYTTS